LCERTRNSFPLLSRRTFKIELIGRDFLFHALGVEKPMEAEPAGADILHACTLAQGIPKACSVEGPSLGEPESWRSR